MMTTTKTKVFFTVKTKVMCVLEDGSDTAREIHDIKQRISKHIDETTPHRYDVLEVEIEVDDVK